jgi:hypothetical protein
MGLDMYLYRKTFVWGDLQKKLVAKMPKKLEHIKSDKISYIVEEIGYWRKANQIHKWFVDNIQRGKDDCKEYDVSKEELQSLLSICKRVKESSKLVDGAIKNGSTIIGGVWMPIVEEGKEIVNTEIAEELLPTKSGFFFGNTDYDQYYMADIDNTIEILETVLNDVDEHGYLKGDITYTSSW